MCMHPMVPLAAGTLRCLVILILHFFFFRLIRFGSIIKSTKKSINFNFFLNFVKTPIKKGQGQRLVTCVTREIFVQHPFPLCSMLVTSHFRMTIALFCIVIRAVCAMQHVEHPAAKQPTKQPANENNQCDMDSSTYVAGSFERELFSKASNGKLATKHHAAAAWNAGTAAAATAAATAAAAATFLVKNISVGQSGALVQEWIVGAGTDHEFHLMFKHTEGEREPSFYKSDLYQRYTNVSKHSLLIYHVEEDNSMKNTTWFNILMEKGGIHYPGGPRSRYVVPRADPTSAAFKMTDDDSVSGDNDNDKMERFQFAQHWVPAIIDELARFHSLFWQDPDLKPEGFYLSITKLLVDVIKGGDLLEKASHYFNIADKDPTTKIKKYPFLSGFGRLGMFESLQTNVGLIKGPCVDAEEMPSNKNGI